jgi:hypothetical protein
VLLTEVSEVKEVKQVKEVNEVKEVKEVKDICPATWNSSQKFFRKKKYCPFARLCRFRSIAEKELTLTSLTSPKIK